jgi:hypothetical protein
MGQTWDRTYITGIESDMETESRMCIERTAQLCRPKSQSYNLHIFVFTY